MFCFCLIYTCTDFYHNDLATLDTKHNENLKTQEELQEVFIPSLDELEDFFNLAKLFAGVNIEKRDVNIMTDPIPIEAIIKKQSQKIGH